MKKTTITFVFGCMTLVAMGGCVVCLNCKECRNKARAQRNDTINFPSSAGKTLICKSDCGNIFVKGGQTSDSILNAEIIAEAATAERAAELLDNTKITYEVTDNEITIRPDCPIKKNKESVCVKMDIAIDRQTSLKLHTSFGEVKINQIQGDADANTGFGKIIVQECQGDLKLNTSFGNIDVHQLSGNKATLNTSFGDIYFENNALPASFQGKFTTSHGKIQLNKMNDFAGKVKLSTSFGSVKSALPITLSGTLNESNLSGRIGQGDGNIIAETSFGSISLN